MDAAETTTTIPAGLSAANAQLYRRLTKHLGNEDQLVREYERLVGSSSPFVSFLAGLIAEDERRHHGLYEEWIESLDKIAELHFAGLPPTLTPAEAAELEATTERLLEVERNDATELQALQSSVAQLKDETLWGLVLEVMRMDTDKHIRILQFIRDCASERRT